MASNSSTTGLHLGPTIDNAKPNKIATSSTCKILPFGERIHHSCGDNIHQKVCHALLLGGSRVVRHGFGVQRRWVDVEACTRMRQIAHQHAGKQRQRGHDLKVQQRFPPIPPTFFKFSMPAMPVTTVQKIITVMTMVIRRIKPSPRGFILTADTGLATVDRS